MFDLTEILDVAQKQFLSPKDGTEILAMRNNAPWEYVMHSGFWTESEDSEERASQTWFKCQLSIPAWWQLAIGKRVGEA